MLNFLQTDVVAQVAEPELTMYQQFSPFIMMGLMILVLWLFMWRPESKRRKAMETFRAGLKKGDKVVSLGGIYGTIKDIKETTVMLEISNGVVICIEKSMVSSSAPSPSDTK